MEDRPHLSITLPRNFMFHYQDGQPPRTPEPDAQVDDLQPPPPPRQVLKVRRRRTTFVPTQIFNDPDDGLPIPTIEAPELHLDTSPELPTLQPAIDNEYLSPALTWSRMLSPPKTPVSQMGSLSSYDSLQHWSRMDQACQSETSSRPTSSSGFSDSSHSSFDSFESLPSLGGSCTSSEDERLDPFVFGSPISKHTPMLSSPLAPQQRQHQQPKLKLKATFTEEMDYHLWMTYMKYLQDPTVTPFKALPTIVPPNGVCHRVARLARHTWKGPRKSPLVGGVRSAPRGLSRSGTPDTIRPANSGCTTPVGANKPYPRYPAERQVRRRLRYLAKQKPTLSAHYQRLLHRSPSPFQSSPPPEAPQPTQLSSPFSQPTASFSTRDMNISLATSTAPSMQAGNPLSRLANNETPRPAEVDRAHMRASAHQKSQSLHIGLGLGLSNVFSSSLDNAPQADVPMAQTNARTWHAASARPPKLGSPVQLHAPRPISRAFKRRALHNFEDQARSRGNSFISHVFGAPAESSHRRVRSRGFSLGDMAEGSRRLPLSTSGPAGFNPFANPPGAAQVHAQLSPVSPAEVQRRATIRLGSPFGGRPSNTFPRASTSHGFEPPASFEQRFAALPSDHAYLPRH